MKMGIFTGKIYKPEEYDKISECCNLIKDNISQEDLEDSFRKQHAQCGLCYYGAQGSSRSLECMGKEVAYNPSAKLQCINVTSEFN